MGPRRWVKKAGTTPLGKMEMEMIHNRNLNKGDVVRLTDDHSYVIHDAGRYDPDDDDAPYVVQRVRLDAGSVIGVDHVGDDVYGNHNGERVHLTTARFDVVTSNAEAG